MILSYISKVIIFIALYFSTAWFGLKMDAAGGFATLVWAPTGIALAALLLYGYWLWPAIAITALCVNYFSGAPLLAAAGISLGNTLEAVLAAYLLDRHTGFDKSLSRVKDVLWFLVIAVILSTFVSATIGVSSLWLSDIIPTEKVFTAWHFWWRGDIFGNLIVAPLLLVWGTRSWNRIKLGDIFEIGVLFILTIVASLLVFGVFGRLNIGFPDLPLLFILFPFVVWASFRFFQIGNVTTTFILAGFALWGAATGVGPFTLETLSENLLLFHAYLGSLSVMGLTLAASAAERKLALKNLQKSKLELQDALRVRDEFISIASHELKTPLVNLSLQLQMLRKSVNEKKPLEVTVRSCEAQAKRLSLLIDELLDLTRIRIGKFDLNKELMDLSEVVRESIALGTNSMISVEADSPAIGYWDQTRIEQIVNNLITNATKYGKNRPITVRVLNEPNLGIAKLEVKDQGVGIAPEIQTEIFKPFKRASSDRFASGLGLGLYIVNQLVEAHGGKLRLESTPDKGSTFIVELPLHATSVYEPRASSVLGG